MKRLLIISILISVVSTIEAYGNKSDIGRRLTFGCEWGYIATFHHGIHNNFFSEEGYRVDTNKKRLDYHSNGELYAHIGINTGKYWNFSLYAGYAGIYSLQHAMPVSIRATRYFNENSRGDRWFAFLDAGSGVGFKEKPQEILAGKLGGGYAIALSMKTKISVVASYRVTYAHTTVIYDGYVVQDSMINRNNAYVSAFSIGLSLTF